MREYFRFFIGTPKRAGWTLLGAFIVIAAVDPRLADRLGGMLVGVLIDAIRPFVGPVLMIVFVIIGIHVILRALIGGKK